MALISISYNTTSNLCFVVPILLVGSIVSVTHAQTEVALGADVNTQKKQTTNVSISPTLLQLQQAAISRDPDLKARQAELDIANADIELAKSYYFPTISANMSQNYGQGSGRFGNTNVSDSRTIESGKVGFNITQTIYDPTRKINLEQSKLTARSNDYAISQSYDELTNKVVGLFFDILATQTQLDLLKIQLTLVAEQQAQAQKSFDVGTVSITDVKEAEAKHDKVLAQQAALQWQYKAKQKELSTLTGGLTINPKDYRSSSKVLPDLDEESLTHYIDTIPNHNAQLQQAKLDYQISTLSDVKHKYQHYPRVQLVVDNYRNFEPMTQAGHNGYANNKWEWSVGLQMSFNLFSPDTSLAQNTKAKAEQNQRYNTMQALQERITIELQQTLYQILASNANYQGLYAAEQSAKAALSANMLGYQVGMRINADVLEAQNKVYEVNNDKLTAWYDSWRNYVKLQQLAGTLDTNQLIQIDELLRQAVEYDQVVEPTTKPMTMIPKKNLSTTNGLKNKTTDHTNSQLKENVQQYQYSLQPKVDKPILHSINQPTPNMIDTGN